MTRFVKDSAYELGSVEEFRRGVFLKYLKARALIVAYDAPREIGRIAIKWNKSKKTTAGVFVLFPNVPGQEDGQDAPQRIRTRDFD